MFLPLAVVTRACPVGRGGRGGGEAPELGEVAFGVALTPVEVGFGQNAVQVRPVRQRRGTDGAYRSGGDVGDEGVDDVADA